ncbi:hypothetical protein ACFZCL_07140 [Streptomyces sp. NPDC008159]|uniref:hypothetical protein n=1 Tax=Streptomyces sp. NPDC008159 TaxID=3364817 RepID=UPI0036ED0462
MRHGGAWRADSRRPPASASPATLYLTADGGLDLTPPTAPDASVTHDVDPHDPVPTLEGQVTSGEQVMSGGAYDQIPPSGRSRSFRVRCTRSR